MPTSRPDDRGSVLLLQVFLVVVVVMGITVIADVGSVIGRRTELAATADQAALAGAQTVDLDAYYRHGAGATSVDLDPQRAAAAVSRYLAPAQAAGRIDGLRIEEVTVAGDAVYVTLVGRAPLPFSSLVGLDSFPISASASAQLLIQP